MIVFLIIGWLLYAVIAQEKISTLQKIVKSLESENIELKKSRSN